MKTFRFMVAGFVGLLVLLLILDLAQPQGTEAVARMDAVYVLAVQRSRRLKDSTFLTSPSSPLPYLSRATFHGLRYFAVEPVYRFTARFEPFTSPVDTTLQLAPAGSLTFTFQGEPCKLTAFWEDQRIRNRLFVPFQDSTTGKECYAGGRYLNLRLQKEGTVELDFNFAYNPYCVYDPKFYCPKPPPENKLPFGVRAGEKLPPG